MTPILRLLLLAVVAWVLALACLGAAIGMAIVLLTKGGA
jgi:hypothetical protein